MLETHIRSLSETGMFLLYEDVIQRIGSHVIGGQPDVNYIRKQERILNLIQDELARRK